jgi:CheY-like chemotaxis protein
LSALRTGDPLRILIAEDTDDNLTLVRHYLRGQPVTLEFVRNGYEAVDAVRRPGDFHLILMDLDMPGLDGRAATRQIREWESASERSATPIVALSAHAIHEEVRACLDAGCIAHVAKPVDQATLIETIERYARAPGCAVLTKRLAVANEIASLVPRYLASKASEIEEAQAHLAGRNFEPIWRFGHNLKGTGRGYGFPGIEELGRALEKSAKDADEVGVARELLALHRFVSEAAVSVHEGVLS